MAARKRRKRRTPKQEAPTLDHATTEAITVSPLALALVGAYLQGMQDYRDNKIKTLAEAVEYANGETEGLLDELWKQFRQEE